MEQKKLFLLDAYALIYRAYYAMIRSPRITSKGFNTSAIFGFVNTLDEILRKENPSHIAVCFDPHGPTFRHEAYPEYKAQRQAQPEDITLSVPYIKSIIEAYNIPVIEVPGFEADDVIGTLSRRAGAEGYYTYMMTPDKDYGQLVSDRVFMYRPSLRGHGFEIRGVREVCERYAIDRPSQVIDLLALEGDASDNVPGCPGVGEKTAAKLIKEWGSVENLLDNVGSLKGALKKKIEENADKIRFSKFLVTIKTDVPVEIDIDSLRRKPENVDRLLEIYGELEFKTFASRLRQSLPETEQPKSQSGSNLQLSLFDAPGEPPVEADSFERPVVETLRDSLEVARFVETACRGNETGCMIYAVGPEAMTAKLNGIALSAAGRTVYVPVPAAGDERQELMTVLAPLFSSESTLIVSHDVKRDMLLLRRENVMFTARSFDTSVAHYLIQPEMRHSLPQVAFTMLGYTTEDYADATAGRKPYGTVEGGVEAEARRFGEAAAIMLRLLPAFRQKLEENNLSRLMNEIEMPFVEVLADMEWTGVRIDVDELAELSRQLTARLDKLVAEAYELAGTEFNIDSPMQVGEILFERLKIDAKVKKTKKGSYSTTEEILEKLRHAHPIVDIILKVRGLRKLLATYINALPALINPETGKIHTTFNQTVTATGRISSTNPNLQNIPVRTDDGREIRRAFIADDGDLFMSADYSQIELRLLADLSGDRDMIDAFRSGADFHAATAAKIYKLNIDDVTADMRRKAKTANFGIVYGISAFGLSERLTIPRAEAKMLIDGYFDSFPGVMDYIEKAKSDAREKGYVTTIMGRKRFLPDINSRNAVVRGYAERNAVNAPLQGSAADIIKHAMIDIHRDIRDRGLRSRMIMQVHDELIFNVVPNELEIMQEIVVKRMTGAHSGNVPLEVSAGVGQNWLEAH